MKILLYIHSSFPVIHKVGILVCKKFKNKDDLTHHAKEYDGITHKCPDCAYENPDV